MFKRVLVANRGAIACRIQRTLRRMGVGVVAVYSEADRHSPHVLGADEAVCLGGAAAADSYLRQDRVIRAALDTGSGAIHPGYGFLSESAGFAARCEQAGIAFVGPTPQQMEELGLKHRARALAAALGLPLLPGSGLLRSLEHARSEAERIGYPVMLKSSAGGGGIGMQLCRDAAGLTAAYASVETLAREHIGDGGLFIEKHLEHARHIEVQLFGDGAGEVIALGERDCSLQRRHQKVIEETPAPGLAAATRRQLWEAAVRLGRAARYRSAGTVELLYDTQTGAAYFLEVNTRLQVEHGVTEEVWGVDLVEWMIWLAAGEAPDLAAYRGAPRGHAIQARLYAEDPARGFRPSSGMLSEVRLPSGVRVDTWIETGTEVSALYDPLLAKIIVHAPTREGAIDGLTSALDEAHVHGIETNLDYLRAVVATDVFRDGRPFTRFLASLTFRSATVEVLRAGTEATVQDFPGRRGYWSVGVPPSGPMDDLAFRLGNRLLGNAEDAAGLELTGSGPTLQFACDTVIALTGARIAAVLGDSPVPAWQAVPVQAGSVLRLGAIEGPGQRAYLAVRGGFDVPPYLGSRATFTLGGFGGHAGRALRAGDVLRLAPGTALAGGTALAPDEIPRYGSHWDIRVCYGPHGAPDFFTEQDIETFFATDWKVHYNSSRTGVRLIGPAPTWARPDGGEAGLHPSNIHDNAYAIGAIDYTGDMPVILGPDGPSLGGFVCPAVLTRSDLWKIGQVRPGDSIRFRRQDLSATPVLHRLEAAEGRVAVCYRSSGEDCLLVEYGPPVLDLELRFRVQALMQWVIERELPGIIDLTPGIRSLQIHHDPRALGEDKLLEHLLEAEGALPPALEMEVPSRIVHLPLSWDDPATQLAVDRYVQSVRKDAPWCPSNIEFIRRINGLESVEEVRRIVFEASYLVMGLGDVYLGAPVATPLDPRHRLVTTKYNPARTWTPENAVGIGGAYLCVYGMEGPGGYQLIGRTVQMWNRHSSTADFKDGRQWLLRFFDQIRFHRVTAEELARMRADFPYGKLKLDVEPTTLRLREYRAFLEAHAASIARFKARQQAAFEAERERWKALAAPPDGGGDAPPMADATSPGPGEARIPDGCSAFGTPVAGSVWQVKVEPGMRVAPGDVLVVVEAMKMEVPLAAEEAAEVVEVRCVSGRMVAAGETLLVLRPA